jgi:hypothetical protein
MKYNLQFNEIISAIIDTKEAHDTLSIKKTYRALEKLQNLKSHFVDSPHILERIENDIKNLTIIMAEPKKQLFSKNKVSANQEPPLLMAIAKDPEFGEVVLGKNPDKWTGNNQGITPLVKVGKLSLNQNINSLPAYSLGLFARGYHLREGELQQLTLQYCHDNALTIQTYVSIGDDRNNEIITTVTPMAESTAVRKSR